MKRLIKTLAVILTVFALVFVGCDSANGSGDKTPEPVVEITAAETTETTIKINEVETYDYTALFKITVDGEDTQVLPSYIDSSLVLAAPGIYVVNCVYGRANYSVTVRVVDVIYAVTLSVESISVNQAEWRDYDYNSLFTVTADGVPVAITENMVSSDISGTPGTYYYSVTFGGESKTLTVEVTDEHNVEAVLTYYSLEIPVNELAEYDYTSLFSLYVDGEAVQVTSEMIDSSAVQNASEGDEVQITLNYSCGLTDIEKTMKVKVGAESRVSVQTGYVVTYPNGSVIDLTTLFSITKGGQTIPVTVDMISGTVDYSKIGNNIITLTYEGEDYTALVEVKLGVVVNYATTDTIVIKSGTDKSTYPFANDFVVYVNGIRFKDIGSYIDTSAVDFSTAGVYTAEISLPFSDSSSNLGFWGNVVFDYTTEQITYVVLDTTYSLSVKQETVTLEEGTTSYDVTGNLSLTINGINQFFTTNKSWVTEMVCYYRLLSDPIDFSKSGEQEVVIAVYVYGVDGEPVEVNYTVVIKDDIQIITSNVTVFSGGTVYTRDLFTVYDGGEEVAAIDEYISGKADTFTPGAYAVTINYRGISAEAKVVVLDKAMIGVYKTPLLPISALSTAAEDDDSEDIYDEWYGTASATAGSGYSVASYQLSSDLISAYSLTNKETLGDLIITADSITVNGVVAKEVTGIDGHTLTAKFGTYTYTIYYDNGIVVLDPDNSIKLAFSESKRPMAYFSTDEWNIDDYLIINYSSSGHVLTLTTIAYSIDAVKITSTKDGSSMWYGLYISLVEKTSTDTVYIVKWGELQFAEDFVNGVGTTSSVLFNGLKYKFTIQSDGTAKIPSNTSTEYLYANKTFTGTIGGVAAQLKLDSLERFTLQIGSQTVFSSYGSAYDYSNCMVGGGIDYDSGTITINAYGSDADLGVFSYKFIVDLANNTFVLLEKDAYMGRYEADGMFLFLDGYGSGAINFNTSSYSKTRFTYTVNGNVLNIVYVDTKPAFEYGNGATFFISPLLNVLTVKEFTGASIVGEEFVNTAITDGAIVKADVFVITADALGKNKLLAGIEIVSAEGVWDAAAKQSAIDISAVNFTCPGFYQFSITVQVGGNDVTNYYAVQILAAS